MSYSLSKSIWSVLLVALLCLPPTARAYSSLYILGDSLSDTGNLYAATSRFPLNQIFPEALPQSPYASGRFSNGPVYAESLWSALGMPGSLQASAFGGTNYAVGGARSRYHSFDNSNPAFDPVGGTSSFSSFSLLGQRDALLADHGGVLDGKALYTVWEGSNDMSDAISLFFSGQFAKAYDLVAQAVGDLLAVIQSLIVAGARHLLIPNLPNLGLVPEVVILGKAAQGAASGLTELYNDLVDQSLAGALVDIRRLDTYTLLSDMVADPAAFGLPTKAKVDSACFTGFVGVDGNVCADPQNYLFWDKIHPSAVVHAELGRLAALAVPEPATLILVALALALAALAGARRKVLAPVSATPWPRF